MYLHKWKIDFFGLSRLKNNWHRCHDEKEQSILVKIQANNLDTAIPFDTDNTTRFIWCPIKLCDAESCIFNVSSFLYFLKGKKTAQAEGGFSVNFFQTRPRLIINWSGKTIHSKVKRFTKRRVAENTHNWATNNLKPSGAFVGYPTTSTIFRTSGASKGNQVCLFPKIRKNASIVNPKQPQSRMLLIEPAATCTKPNCWLTISETKEVLIFIFR